MVKEGVMENVSAIFGLHTVHAARSPRARKFLAGCGSFKAVIGAGAVDDPILAASTSIISLQNIVSRDTDPFGLSATF